MINQEKVWKRKGWRYVVEGVEWGRDREKYYWRYGRGRNEKSEDAYVIHYYLL